MTMKQFLLCCLFFIGFLTGCKKEDSQDIPVSAEIRLGAIMDLTGDYSQEGKTGKAAIELALTSLNQRYASVALPIRFSCVFIDTQMDTMLTQKAAGDLYNQGIRLLVGGPGNSTELKSIAPFLNSKKMLALTCFSSTPSLSIPDDYIFRLITDDLVQADALVRMMVNDSVKAIIPIWRDDTYGNGLIEAVHQKFEQEGGILFPGVSYNPANPAFIAMMEEAATQIDQAVSIYGKSSVAILLITYQEASEFLRIASSLPTPGTIKWYGCDANFQKKTITADTAAARFAAKVRFLAPIMGIGTAGRLPVPAENLTSQIFAVCDLTPDAYALSAYDAVQLYGLAFDLTRSSEPENIKTALPLVCGSYDYLGISRKLNEAGDLASANYIFWTVLPVLGGYTWNSYATWMSDGDYILFPPEQ